MSKENKNQKKQDLRASDSVVNQNRTEQKNNKQNSATNSTQEQKKRDGNGM